MAISTQTHPSPPRMGRLQAGVCIAGLALASAAAHAGVITQSASRAALGADDVVQWGTAGDDGSMQPTPFAATSANALGVSVTGPSNVAIFVEGGMALGSNFAPGDIVLDTFFENGPLSISFASAVRGVGFNLASENFGAFTGTLSFYGVGNVLFGSVNVAGTSGAPGFGDTPFIGGTSSLMDITRVEVAVSEVLGGTALMINHMSLVTAVPEPQAWLLGVLAVAGLAGVRTRREPATSKR